MGRFYPCLEAVCTPCPSAGWFPRWHCLPKSVLMQVDCQRLPWGGLVWCSARPAPVPSLAWASWTVSESLPLQTRWPQTGLTDRRLWVLGHQSWDFTRYRCLEAEVAEYIVMASIDRFFTEPFNLDYFSPKFNSVCLWCMLIWKKILFFSSILLHLSVCLYKEGLAVSTTWVPKCTLESPGGP